MEEEDESSLVTLSNRSSNSLDEFSREGLGFPTSNSRADELSLGNIEGSGIEWNESGIWPED
jgi:hypothetical protein